MDEHTSDSPGPFPPVVVAYDAVTLTAPNLKLLTACAVMEDLEAADLNTTLGRALLEYRDRLLHAPSAAVSAPALTPAQRRAQARAAAAK